MRKLLSACLVASMLAVGLFAADGPLTPLMQLRGRTDANGYLLASSALATGSDGPLTPLANLKGRTDGNGYLRVALSGAAEVTSVTVTQGTQTASAPGISQSATWNNAAVSFIGASAAFTETASGASSRYVQILGGAAGTTDEFYVLKGGTIFGATALSLGGYTLTQSAGGGNLTLGPEGNPLTLTNRIRFTPTGSGGLTITDSSGTASTGTVTLAGVVTTGYSVGARSTSSSLLQVTTAVSVSGATTTTGNVIPAGSVVEGVATTTTTTITGASGYTIGDGADADRWGDITGTAIGTASSSTNYTAEPRWWTNAARAITLTAKTSNFTGGVVQVTVFYRTAAGA